MIMNAEAIELVVYRLRDVPANNKHLIVQQTDKGLASLSGFIDRKVYQCTDDDKLLLDYVRWHTLREAEEAAKNMMKVKELEQFVQLIEKTEVFEHFRVTDEHVITRELTDTVEVVVYQLKPEFIDKVENFFDVYSREIASMAGYCQRVLLQSTKTPGLFAERVFWRSAADAVAATQAMEKNTVLGEAFGMVEKVVVMKHFVKLG